MNHLLLKAAERLRAVAIDSPRGEARILWEHAKRDPVTFAALISRRLTHEPIAYMTGHKEFWSLDFEVGPGVLIPRPETETLVEQALGALPDRKRNYRVLDLGTGSGCLLIALLKELPSAGGLGVDTSQTGLDWALRNIARHGLESRSTLLKGDWTTVTGSFDIIVSNPPYVRSGDLTALSPDITDYEPQDALDGGPDGLAAYRALAPVLKGHLAQNGVALLEIGAGQANMVGCILRTAALRIEGMVADLAGIPRCVVVRQT